MAAINPKKPNITIHGLKTWDTREGGGYQCTLKLDGKKVAYVHNEGRGGMLEIDWATEAAEGTITELAIAYCVAEPDMKDLYPTEDVAREHASSARDIFIGACVDHHENTQRLRRYCRKETLFRLKDTPEGQWRTIKAAYSPATRDFIVAKYGDQVAEILNETLAASGGAA